LATTNPITTRSHLGLDVEIVSEAPFVRLREHSFGTRKEIVEGEVYSIKFKFKNLGQMPFPSGNAVMQMRWTSGQWVSWTLNIPELKPEEEQYARFGTQSTIEKSEALSSGYGLLLCFSVNPRSTQLSSLEGNIAYSVGPTATSVRSIKVTSWEAIYSKYSTFIAAGALGIIALQIIAQFLSWLIALLASKHC
jgi:hypothetical protein